MTFRAIANVGLSGVPKSLIGKQLRTQTRFLSVYPSHLSNTPISRVTYLPSGFRVVSADALGDIATVGVWIDSGSARETDSNAGINNFLHKLLLTGGSKPNLAAEVESIGANLSGYTDREVTAIVGQSHKDDLPKIVSILGELVQSSSFKDEKIEFVRSQIINAHRKARDSWSEDVILDHAHAAAFQGTSHAGAVIGEPNVIKSIKSEEIVNFRKQYYTAHNMVLVGTGAVQHEALAALAEDAFKNISPHGNDRHGRVDYVGSEIRIRDDTSHKVKMAISFEAVGRTHPHYWTFLLLQTIVGSWDRDSNLGTYASSRWAEACAVHKLAHKFKSIYKPYTTSGLFSLYAETNAAIQDDSVYGILNEFQKLATYFSEQELARAKNQLKTTILANLENPVALAQNLGETIISGGRPVYTSDFFQRIDDIELADVQHLLSTFFYDVDPVVIAHGPIEDFTDYNVIRSWTYWNRW